MALKTKRLVLLRDIKFLGKTGKELGDELNIEFPTDEQLVRIASVFQFIDDVFKSHSSSIWHLALQELRNRGHTFSFIMNGRNFNDRFHSEPVTERDVMDNLQIVENWVDAQGNPAGGTVTGIGLCVSWQNGPLGRGDNRKAPNGAFVEDLIEACIRRLQFFQNSRFNCVENEEAISYLKLALGSLNARTNRREQANTEGTHSGS